MAFEVREGSGFTRGGKRVAIHLNGDDETYPFFHDNGKGEDGYHGITADGRSCIGSSENDVVEMEAPIESPIRTVTRREPVSGKYSNGDVDVSVHPDGQIQISVSMLTLKGDRVRSACMVLSQLAEFLDEDKGDE